MNDHWAELEDRDGIERRTSRQDPRTGFDGSPQAIEMNSRCGRGDEVALELQLTGWCVTQCCVDHAFTIKLWGQQGEFSIRIEADFAFVPSRGAEIVPVQIGSIRELAPVLEVFGSSIDRAVVYEDRKLRIDFSNGMSISVEPDEKYEAWNVSGPHGFLVVALPGGGIATWRSKGNVE